MIDELPDGWSSVAVGEVFSSHGGGTPSRAITAYWGGQVPWLSSGDIKSDVISGASESITARGLQESTAHLCRPGSVLVVVRSGILKHTLPVAVLGSEAAINQDIKCFDCGFDELNGWLALAWRASAKTLLGENREGTTVQSVKLETLNGFVLPVPPLPEQRRIVAKVEEVLAKVDACQERLAKIPVLLKRFRQAVLAAACSGKLTKDWRDQHLSEDSEQLIARIGESRRQKLRAICCARSEGRLASLSDFDNFEPRVRTDLQLFELPGAWRWVDLRFLMTPEEPFCYGVVQPGDDESRGPRMIRVCDIENSQVLGSQLRGISPKVHAQYERSVLKGGELLVSVVGTIGRAAIASADLAGANIARAVAKIPIREFEAWFVLYWLSTSVAEAWMIGDAREVARKTLNLQQLRTLPIPLPPVAEQREIVRRVGALFAVAERIALRYVRGHNQLNELTPSLLARAFRGELVPTEAELARREGRPFEPASALLDRLRSHGPGTRKAAVSQPPALAALHRGEPPLPPSHRMRRQG